MHFCRHADCSSRWRLWKNCGHRLYTMYGTPFRPSVDLKEVFFTTSLTSCHAGCLAWNATVGSSGFARPSISLSGTFFSESDYDFPRWFSRSSFLIFNMPDRDCWNKLLVNWKGSLKKLSLLFRVLLLFRQRRFTKQRALHDWVLSSCRIAHMPYFQGPLRPSSTLSPSLLGTSGFFPLTDINQIDAGSENTQCLEINPFFVSFLLQFVSKHLIQFTVECRVSSMPPYGCQEGIWP